MKFIHVADIHASRERLSQTLSILNTLTERCKKGDIDFILFAGDFWDSTITATKGSGFSDILTAMKELGEQVNRIYMIYGTPRHEPNGSLDAFDSSNISVINGKRFVSNGICRFVFISEPRRSNYITTSAKETDEAINADIKDWLEKSEKWTDNLEDNHTHKPLVVVYHGEVKGAVYQNGVSASSPTAIPKELLESLNADYYALGHIHMPQEIFPNAWYPGSACPKNFGEPHDGCYNLVSIENGETKVERVSFGLPVYETHNVFFGDFTKTNADFSNKHIRLQFDCTKEEKKALNIKQACDEIKERTNALSVKLEPNVIECDTTERSEVVKHKSIVEKMTEYAKEKMLNVPKHAKELLQNIQDNTLVKLAYPQHSFELLSLSLRGAIGIRDGQHKEDFDINFEQYEDGVICLVGPCGHGKCVTGDTFILSEKGFENIGSFDNKERGFRPFEKNLISEKNSIAQSSHFYSEDVSQTIKITNSLGMELEGTLEHPVLVFMPDCTYQFKKLKDISLEDYVCIPRNMNIFPKEHYNFSFKPFIWRNTKKIVIPSEMNVLLAKFLGYYIANGSHTGNCIQFSTQNEIIGDDYIKCVKELFNINVNKTFYKSSRAPNYRLDSSIVKQFLEYIFNSKLTTGRYKIIPDCILQGTEDEQRAFITAIFDCDGCLSKNIFEYLSASKQIVIALQNMLLNFGIVASHRTKRVKNYDWIYHRLIISSLCVDNLFYKILNKSLKYQYSRHIPVNTNIDVIPYLKQRIYEYLPRLKNGYLRSKDGNLYRNPIQIQNLKNNFSYASLGIFISETCQSNIPEVREVNELCRCISQKFYYFSKIEKIEKLNQKKTVYDFTIPSTHRFYSNGFISHNSTLIENCHPYPQMLTREGTLKDHFYLKDSHRILLYKDENGLYYKISMLIDGKTATGKTSYFVETSKDREAWHSLPEVDGSLDCYKKWVEQTFGSIDVFLRTAFFAKEPTKNATDIAATTKSERMELLSKLAGTDQLKEVSVIAREQRKEVEKAAEKIESEIESYNRYEDNIKENENDITSWSNELKGLEKTISVEEKNVSEFKTKDAEYQKVKTVAEANKALKQQYQKQYDETKNLFDKFDEAVNNSILFDKVGSSNKVISDNAPLITDLMKKSKEVNKKIEELTESILKEQKKESEKKLEVSKIESEIKLCESQIVDIEEVCPTCGQPISEHKRQELLSHINKSKDELGRLGLEHVKARNKVCECKSIIQDIEDERDSFADERTRIESSLADLQSETHSCEEFLETVDEIYTEHTYAEAVEEHQKLSKELDELRRHLDEVSDETALEDVSEKLSEAERQLQSDMNRKAELNADIKAVQKENEKYRKELDSVADKKAELKKLNEKITAYLFIEDAFSNNGIPAIELRESAPEIADIANKILADSYGNKFEIRFGSTSELKTKRKANEDFSIIVYDSENGDEKTIDLVSSGERIWIKQALFYAFSIVQMNRTGFNFRTRLIDESDGSLDGSLRPKYLNMVTSAHRQADARISVLITHSQEIKDIAQQIIEI